jgi:hypothetical protein
MFGKQKGSLFNEKMADEEVIRSLLREISKLKGELKMVRIVKSSDGKYYRGEFEEVAPEEVTQLVTEKQQQLSELEAIAPGADVPSGPSEPAVENPATPDATPADASAPAQPADPAPATPAEGIVLGNDQPLQ